MAIICFLPQLRSHMLLGLSCVHGILANNVCEVVTLRHDGL